jgi:hypothetical protein
MPCELERVNGRVAAHESYHRALNRIFEIAQPDDFEIDAWSRKPGARGNDQVGDFLVRRLREEPIDRLRCQARRFFVVFAHAGSCRRKIVDGVKSLIVERFIEAGLGGTQRRPAASNVRSSSHSFEKKPGASILYHAVGKTDERGMDVVVGGGNAEAVQIGVAHKLTRSSDVGGQNKPPDCDG